MFREEGNIYKGIPYSCHLVCFGLMTEEGRYISATYLSVHCSDCQMFFQMFREVGNIYKGIPYSCLLVCLDVTAEWKEGYLIFPPLPLSGPLDEFISILPQPTRFQIIQNNNFSLTVKARAPDLVQGIQIFRNQFFSCGTKPL